LNLLSVRVAGAEQVKGGPHDHTITLTTQSFKTKNQAKQLVKRHHAADASICDSFRELQKLTNCSDAKILGDDLVLSDAQQAIALHYGFEGWLALRNHTLATDPTTADDGGLNLSRSQIAEFRHRGILKLPGLLSNDVIDPARERIDGVLAGSEMFIEGIWIAERLNGMKDYKIQSGLLKALNHSTKRSPEFASICSAELQSTAEQLMDGQSLVTTVKRPQILFTAPNAEPWEPPHKVWHMDIPRLGKIGCPGVQMFTFIDQVNPGAAGTVVAAGSHHYVNDQGRVKSKPVKKQLRQSPPCSRHYFAPMAVIADDT
jgi:hypothetical protein